MVLLDLLEALDLLLDCPPNGHIVVLLAVKRDLLSLDLQDLQVLCVWVESAGRPVEGHHGEFEVF